MSIDKELLVGSAYGWTKVLDADESLHTVAKWRGEVWVGAAPPLGLCKLENRQLTQVAPPLLAMKMDVRGDLLMTTNSHIAQTTDGKKFAGRDVASFLSIVENDPPSWR